MTPDQFQKTAVRIFGRKHWKAQMARAMGVDVSTIHRLGKRDQIPGPYEVALQGMLAHALEQRKLEAAARRLLPRKFRYRKRPVKSKNPRKDQDPCTSSSSETSTDMPETRSSSTTSSVSTGGEG
jgi:hypothetical protein